MFKNKNVQIGLGVVLVAAVLLGGYFFVAGKSKDVEQEEPGYQEAAVETISPESIGLTIEVSKDKKKVKFMIAKATGIKTIEYELTYEADSTAQEQSEGGEDRVQRGITGDAKVTTGASYESEWLDLGSCSKNVCRYDKGVEKIDLTLKLIKSDGKTYQTTTSHEF